MTSTIEMPPVVSDKAPDFVKNVTAKIIAGVGDIIPVSAMPVDGTFPTGTAQWEKRNIALEIPVWDESICIQCGKCAMVCPHATIRIKVYDPKYLAGAPPTFKSMDYKGNEYKGMKYTIQVAPEDCTGCGLCVEVCPAKNKSETRLKAINMKPQPPIREPERVNYDFFLNLPEVDRRDCEGRYDQRFAIPAAVVRIFRRVLGMRRNTVCEIGQSVVWRSSDHCKCNRMLVDIWRQSPDKPMDRE